MKTMFRIKRHTVTSLITQGVAFLGILLCSLALGNSICLPKKTAYANALMDLYSDSPLALRVADNAYSNAVIWQNDWYLGYDVAYHYAASETKALFSADPSDMTASIEDVAIPTFDNVITTSSRVHEYRGLYYGDYLGIDAGATLSRPLT